MPVFVVMSIKSSAKRSSVLHRCRNNENFHLSFLNHIIASGCCSKAFSFFESHDASVTPGDMNWKSEIMSNVLLKVFEKI